MGRKKWKGKQEWFGIFRTRPCGLNINHYQQGTAIRKLHCCSSSATSIWCCTMLSWSASWKGIVGKKYSKAGWRNFSRKYEVSPISLVYAGLGVKLQQSALASWVLCSSGSQGYKDCEPVTLRRNPSPTPLRTTLASQPQSLWGTWKEMGKMEMARRLSWRNTQTKASNNLFSL